MDIILNINMISIKQASEHVDSENPYSDIHACIENKLR